MTRCWINVWSLLIKISHCAKTWIVSVHEMLIWKQNWKGKQTYLVFGWCWLVCAQRKAALSLKKETGVPEPQDITAGFGSFSHFPDYDWRLLGSNTSSDFCCALLYSSKHLRGSFANVSAAWLNFMSTLSICNSKAIFLPSKNNSSPRSGSSLSWSEYTFHLRR